MLNRTGRSWLLGGWLASIGVVVSVSVVMEANLSTSALFLAIGIAPAVIMMLLGGGAPSPTVAELLHSVEAKDGR